MSATENTPPNHHMLGGLRRYVVSILTGQTAELPPRRLDRQTGFLIED